MIFLFTMSNLTENESSLILRKKESEILFNKIDKLEQDAHELEFGLMFIQQNMGDWWEWKQEVGKLTPEDIAAFDKASKIVPGKKKE